MTGVEWITLVVTASWLGIRITEPTVFTCGLLVVVVLAHGLEVGRVEEQSLVTTPWADMVDDHSAGTAGGAVRVGLEVLCSERPPLR